MNRSQNHDWGFTKDSFRNTSRASNSLDPDQAQHFVVGPHLGPNCSRQRDTGIPILKSETIEEICCFLK